MCEKNAENNIRSEAFAVAKVNKIFLDCQPCLTAQEDFINLC
jgi:hypothetical protein